MADEDYTTSTALLEALESAGVSHLFLNVGSDHPAILEAISKQHIEGQPKKIRFITAPHEFVGLSAAQGYFQASGEMQAVLVHVDAGTLSMAGAIHNVARARIPVLILAGTSPITDEGELRGSRNEFIHSLQDTVDQRGIMRGYTVYNNEIRSGRNVKQLVLRASQFAKSEPHGAAYLMASRECLEDRIRPYHVDATKWKPTAPSALSPASVETIGNALLNASRPIVVTTYLGKDIEAAGHLLELAEALGIAVLEALPSHLNFPYDHPLYMGNHWSEEPRHALLETADVVLVIDCDVPWIKTAFKPPENGRVYHIDVDPLKVQMSLFHLDTDLSCQANARTALQQLHHYVSSQLTKDHASKVQSRIQDLEIIHREYISGVAALEKVPEKADVLTPHYVLSRLRSFLDDDTIILNEGISNYKPVADVLKRFKPGSYLTSGATALGWHGGAAIGVKLAQPTKTVVAITGDGTFLFSIPSSVHWMARKYEAPFLTLILNNRGWKSPMLSTVAVHKNGYSSKMQSDDLHVTFDPSCNHAQIAVAAGAGYGATVKTVAELDGALQGALKTVREEGRAAVVDVWLPKFLVGDRVG
ncbi:acetolactate synthase [Leptodontidium sp. MPI-SDFR-AT-0119]|nr:acetolactate synthase [Leptodontidium sp. MPI-SDFR-AT-0119]